jgi:ubiquinone/menaquinone biosynthesis C-methylase UbiE
LNRFDEAAKTWDTKPSSLAMAKACVENINKIIKLKDDSKILDYGCGTGLVAFSLSNETNEVIGMDNSNGMVEQFNKKAKELDFSNIKAIQHNIDNEDLTQNEFDLIITSMSLHHIKNANIFIEKAYKALKNDGFLCINDLDKEDGTFHKKHNNEGVYHFGFDKNELENSLKNLGFKIIDYKIVHTDIREDREFPIFNLIAQK